MAGGRASADPDDAADDADGTVREEHDELTELLRACLVALRLPLQAASYQPRRSPFWSVSDAITRINRLLPTLPEGAALEVFLPEARAAGPVSPLRRKAAHAATLIAALELAREGELTLGQDVLWQTIHVA